MFNQNSWPTFLLPQGDFFPLKKKKKRKEKKQIVILNFNLVFVLDLVSESLPL